MKNTRLVLTFCAVVGQFSVSAAVFTVTTTNDSGPGSLRQTILDVNASPSVERHNIDFNIAGDEVHVIRPSSQLPEITRSVVIDGYTQPGARPCETSNSLCHSIKICVDGRHVTNASSGLVFTTNNNMVRGLSVLGFGFFQLLFSRPGSQVVGSFIGLAPDGSTNKPGSGVGVFAGVVGGVHPADGNVISGNFTGVFLDNELNRVVGNFIGTDPTGTLPLPNLLNGVVIGDHSCSNIIGGADAFARNVISGNLGNGIRVAGPFGSIEGNYVGADVTGKRPLPNNGDGIFGSTLIAIGGSNAASANTIAFNRGFGIYTRFEVPILGNSIYSNGSFGIF